MQYELHGEHRELQTYPPQGSDRIRSVIPAGRPRALRSHPGPCGAPRCCGPRRPRHREAFHGRQHANRPGPRVLHDARRLAGDGRSDAGAGGRPRERRKARRGERSGHGDHPASVPSRRPTADQGNSPPARGYRRPTTRAVRRHLSVRAGPGPRTTGEDRRCAGGLPPMGHAGREGLRALRILYFSLGNTVHDRRFPQRIADFGHEGWSPPVSDAGQAHPLLGYDDCRIVQFPWGVDLKEFRPGADDRGLRHEMGWDDSFIVLSTRSWEPLYGIETLLEAFRRAHAKEPRMRLILLGGGSLASKIERFLKSNKLDRFVHRPGVMPHDAISAYFRAVDLYVSCSLSDGSSVSLLEAMATGLPVVVSDTPGNREWVVSGKNGWLAPVGDAEAFAGHLITSSRSGSSARARISQANRGIAERRADWSRNSGQLRQAYERLAGA